MADTPYPIPRELRQSAILSGDGVNATYGPFSWKIFDLADVTVWARASGEAAFVPVAASIAKVSGLPQDFFTVTFSAPLPETTEFVVAGSRLHERTSAITRGPQLDPGALEKELSKQGVVLQELTRDLGRALKVGIGRGADDLPVPDGKSLIGWGPDGSLVNKGLDAAMLDAAINAALLAKAVLDDFILMTSAQFAVKLNTKTIAGVLDYDLMSPAPALNGHLHVSVRVDGSPQPKDGIAYTIINEGATIHLSEDPGDDVDLYVEGAAVYGMAIPANPELPEIAPSTMLVGNAGGTARDNKTFPEVRALLGIDRPKHPDEIKLLITADWQCLPDVPEQLIAERAMMADIQAQHSDADWALFLGDLVDRPTENSTGAPSARGYKELFEDMRARIPSIPLARWLFLSGNHDRDGTGAGMWKDAWTLKSYRSEVGPLWYHVDYGNLRMIFMGDMSGSVSGEVLDVAIDWFKLVMERSKNYNVIVSLHQPPDPTVYPPSTDPTGGAFQRNPARITDVIAAYDNVVCCFYGHVGSNLNDATLVTSAHGTTWMNMQMGIPTAFNNGFDLHYATAVLKRGAMTFDVVRWNATQHAPLGLNDATITLKFPFYLSGDHLDFDGRRQTDPQVPISYGPVVSYQSASDFRADGPLGVPDEMLIAHKIIVGDDAANNLTTQGVATGYYVPGASDSDTDSGGNQVYSQPAYGLGGLIGFRRQSNDDTDYGSAFEVWCRAVGTGTLDRAMEVRPLSSLIAGINMAPGFGFSINGTYAVDANGHFRLRTYTKSQLLALSSSPVGMMARCLDGGDGSPCVAISLGDTLGWAKIAIGAVIS